MFAPRLGVVYDWTKVAKGKLFGHWGRFYESVPMQINDRSFGGEVFDYSDFISQRRRATSAAPPSTASARRRQPLPPRSGGRAGAGETPCSAPAACWWRRAVKASTSTRPSAACAVRGGRPGPWSLTVSYQNRPWAA
jgi:hypothetical protein